MVWKKSLISEGFDMKLFALLVKVELTSLMDEEVDNITTGMCFVFSFSFIFFNTSCPFSKGKLMSRRINQTGIYINYQLYIFLN